MFFSIRKTVNGDQAGVSNTHPRSAKQGTELIDRRASNSRGYCTLEVNELEFYGLRISGANVATRLEQDRNNH
jgi:hypothetical protein